MFNEDTSTLVSKTIIIFNLKKSKRQTKCKNRAHVISIYDNLTKKTNRKKKKRQNIFIVVYL